MAEDQPSGNPQEGLQGDKINRVGNLFGALFEAHRTGGEGSKFLDNHPILKYSRMFSDNWMNSIDDMALIVSDDPRYVSKPGGREQRKQELKKRVSPRKERIGSIILDIFPGQEEMMEVEGSLRIPNEKIEIIFSKDIAKQAVRKIDFLLDEGIIAMWMGMQDSEFNNFCDLAEKQGLPECLFSTEEEVRNRQRNQYGMRLGTGAFSGHLFSTHLYNVAAQLVSASFDDNLPLDSWSKRRPEEKAPARFLLQGLYYNRKEDLGKAIRDLEKFYPNEHIPSST